ncbi:MAG: hypothetical protein AVDCRST_MAG54-3252, partial [uncultured Actinomycetospora sp.]
MEALREKWAVPTRFAPGGELGEVEATPFEAAEPAGREDFAVEPPGPPDPPEPPGFGLGEGLAPDPRRVTLTPGAPSEPDGCGPG